MGMHEHVLIREEFHPELDFPKFEVPFYRLDYQLQETKTWQIPIVLLEICFGLNQSLQVKTTKNIGLSLLLKINFQTTEQSTLETTFFFLLLLLLTKEMVRANKLLSRVSFFPVFFKQVLFLFLPHLHSV